MSYSEKAIKRLFARSQNQCAMPGCTGQIVVGETVVGEICHIRARRKRGPRFDSRLSLAERNAYENLLLLCRTCHRLIDSDDTKYSVGLLSDIKTMQEKEGGMELSSAERHAALLLLENLKPKRATSGTASDGGIVVAIGGDNNGRVTINQTKSGSPSTSGKYPANSIGADANFAGYADYLFGLGVDYWKGVDAMSPGRLGQMIKRRFRLKQRTRNHLPVDRFGELVEFIIDKILNPSPVGKRHFRNGTKPCRSFEEWRSGPMS